MSNVIDEVVEGLDPLPDLLSVMAASSTPALLALDIGTSGVRATLFDDYGIEVIGTSVRINFAEPALADRGTIEAGVLLDRVFGAIDEVLDNIYDPSTRIDLIAVSCFWHSLIGVDSRGRPTTQVLSWNDLRAATQVHKLRSQFNEAEIHARTGCRFHSSYWPAKLLRLRNEEPEAFVRTERWLSFPEYLTLQLFGEALTSVSMASGTGVLNQKSCEWEVGLLRGLDIDVAQLPQIAATGQTLNELAGPFAARWPQLKEARLLPAIGDGAANNIGAGCLTKDHVALMVGSSGAMRVVYEGEPPDTIPPELWCYRVDRHRVVIGGALSDGGNLYAWIRRSLLNEFDAQSLEDELAALKPDAHGLTILPFWCGERSTGWHEHARGVIEGLSSSTQSIEILRAAMESIAYRFALVAQALQAVAPHAVVIASGNALCSSPTWVQILADVLGAPIQLSQSEEASTRGAALLALEATGKIHTIDRSSVTVNTRSAVFEPDVRRHEKYRSGLERQQRLYEKIISTSGR